MIGQPCLPPLPFAPDRITHDVALVGVALHLDEFRVEVISSRAPAGLWIGVHSLKTQVEPWNAGKTGQEKAGAHPGMARRINRIYIIVNHVSRVQSHPMIEPG